MDEIEILAKALAFEYYVGVVEAREDLGETNVDDAVSFYEAHSDDYLEKASNIFTLISENYTTKH